MTLSGLKFPLQINSFGRFALATENEKIRQNLERIASTAIRERWYEPNMGTIGYDALFRALTAQTANQIATLVQEAINEQEPRVLAQVRAQKDQEREGKLVLTVLYVRKDNKTKQTVDIILNRFK